VTTKVATAIAKTVRIIVVLLGAHPEDKTLQKRSRFRAIPSRFRDRPSNSAISICRCPQGRWNFPPPTAVIC
jgi:hypothetical protein